MKEMKKIITWLTICFFVSLVLMIYCRSKVPNSTFEYLELFFQSIFTGTIISLIISLATYLQKKNDALNVLNEDVLELYLKVNLGKIYFSEWIPLLKNKKGIFPIRSVNAIMNVVDSYLDNIIPTPFAKHDYDPFIFEYKKYDNIQEMYNAINRLKYSIYTSASMSKIMLQVIERDLIDEKALNKNYLNSLAENLTKIDTNVKKLANACKELNEYLEDEFKIVFPHMRISNLLK